MEADNISDIKNLRKWFRVLLVVCLMNLILTVLILIPGVFKSEKPPVNPAEAVNLSRSVISEAVRTGALAADTVHLTFLDIQRDHDFVMVTFADSLHNLEICVTVDRDRDTRVGTLPLVDDVLKVK